MTRAAFFMSIAVTKFILTFSFGMLPLPHKERIIRNKKYTFSIRASKSDEQSPKDHIPQLNLLDNSSLDSELRPTRLPTRNGKKKKIQNMSDELVGNTRNIEWGIETIDDPSQRPQCPKSFEEVAEEAFTAISSTLYFKQKLDPNIASNAMAVSIHDKRPVGFAHFPVGRDVGRLGIEIDGARFLLTEGSSKSNENQDTVDANSPQRDLASYDIANSINGRMLSPRKYGQHTVALEGRALRRYSIILGAKLSQGHWAGLEDNIDSEHDAENASRPVALFFNTIRQALMASKELQLLQKVAKVEKKEGKYDNIRILCLGQDDIPKDMLQKPTTDSNGKKRRKWGGSKALSEGFVNPKNGIILIVQPTDYNNEANPASPVIGTVQQLQKLAAAASIAHLPTVAISPRLTEQFDGNGIEQSGYQKSSTYGGIEVSLTFQIQMGANSSRAVLRNR